MQALPTVTDLGNVVDTLKLWQRALTGGTKNLKVPTIPVDFRSQGKVGGVQLDWAKADDATGYEIAWSPTGDLSSPTIIRLSNPNQTSYFDNIGSSNVTRFYQLRAVNVGDQGRVAEGKYTGVVSSTTQPAPTFIAPIVRDLRTNDRSQVGKGIYIR